MINNKNIMKKTLILFLAIILLFVIYLKIPIYSSGIVDSYFDTKYTTKDTLDSQNGMLILVEYANWLAQNVQEIDVENNPESIEKFLIEEKELYKRILEKDFLKYDTSIEWYISSLVQFEKKKIEYIESKNWTLWFKSYLYILEDSLEQNIAILKNSEWNIIFHSTYETLVEIDLAYLTQLIEKNKLSNWDKQKYIDILKRFPLDIELFTDAVKAEYWKKVRDFDIEFTKSLSGQSPENHMKILTFLLINKSETKELFKNMYKKLIEGNYEKPEYPTIVRDTKNYLWKSFVIWAYSDLSKQKENYLKLIEKIESIK